MILHEPYSFDNHKLLFRQLKEILLKEPRVTFRLLGDSWTIKIHSPSGRLKKEKWILTRGDGSIREYRRLNQVLNYLRSLLGVDMERDPDDAIDDEIRRLIHDVNASKTKNNP